MLIYCPKCGIDLDLPNENVGAKVMCTECGEKFIAPVHQRPIEAECPHCHAVYEVAREELGTNVQCEQCTMMFVVKERTSQGGQSQDHGSHTICEMSVSELSQRAMQIRERNKEVTREKEAVALRDEFIELKNEMARRYEIAKNRAIETSRQNVPFLLKPFSFVFVNFRTMSEDEIYLQKLSSKMALAAREIMMHTNAVVRQDRVRQKKIAEDERKIAEKRAEEERKKAEEERKKKEAAEIEAKIAICKDDIKKCVQSMCENKRPDPICYDYFSRQADEVAYFVEKNVSCIVPRQNKSETYSGGTFVITNKRIIYTTEKHLQTYRMSNIRDFVPCWRLDAGWITVATSDKRRERYKLNEAWRPTILIMFFANDLFREKLLMQDVGENVNHIWGKVVSTQSPLHYRVFGVPFEDFGSVTVCGVRFYDGSNHYKNEGEYRKEYDSAISKLMERMEKGAITTDAATKGIDNLIPPEHVITLDDRTNGRWDDIEAMSYATIEGASDANLLDARLRLSFASFVAK